MTTIPLPRAVAALALLTPATAACGGDTPAAGAPLATEALDRPVVTFAAGGPAIDVPGEVPGGLVDIRIRATDGPAHLLIARLDEGVTLVAPLTVEAS